MLETKAFFTPPVLGSIVRAIEASDKVRARHAQFHNLHSLYYIFEGFLRLRAFIKRLPGAVAITRRGRDGSMLHTLNVGDSCSCAP